MENGFFTVSSKRVPFPVRCFDIFCNEDRNTEIRIANGLNSYNNILVILNCFRWKMIEKKNKKPSLLIKRQLRTTFYILRELKPRVSRRIRFFNKNHLTLCQFVCQRIDSASGNLKVAAPLNRLILDS